MTIRVMLLVALAVAPAIAAERTDLPQAAPAASPAPVPTADGDDIVVTARRPGQCRLSIANRIMADAEFRRLAPQWAAGRPVRIIVPRGSSYQCQARILIRLGRYGVRNAVFVDG